MSLVRTHDTARSRLGFAMLLALLPTGLIALHLGAQAFGHGAWLPVTALLFTLGWAIWASGTRRRRIWVVLFWAVGVHTILWMPFLVSSYLAGQGMGRIDYAVGAGIFTALAVGWYVATDHLWQTALIGGVLIGLITLRHRVVNPSKRES